MATWEKHIHYGVSVKGKCLGCGALVCTAVSPSNIRCMLTKGHGGLHINEWFPEKGTWQHYNLPANHIHHSRDEHNRCGRCDAKMCESNSPNHACACTLTAGHDGPHTNQWTPQKTWE